MLHNPLNVTKSNIQMRNTCPSEAVPMITNFENNTKTLKILMKVSKKHSQNNANSQKQINFYKPIEIL